MRLVSQAHYIPDTRQSITDAILANGQSIYEAKAFGRLFGFENVATLADKTLTHAFETVLGSLDIETDLPDAVIYCHGNPVQYTGDLSPVEELVKTHPALKNVEHVFELDQHTCSTLFWALDVAQGLLRDGTERVLILAGDSVEKMPLTERHALGVTAVGDAFAAIMLDDSPNGTQFDDVYLDMRPEFHRGRTADAKQTGEFNTHHSELVQQILDNVDRSGSRPTAILPHNVNMLTWQKFAKESGIERKDIWLDLLPDVGHCYTVDAATHLDRFFESDTMDATMLSVGQGGFLGGCVLRKEAEICKL
ncbi:MAG: hypothetical protein WA790_17640 [Sulfitobacter sp.]